jgi:hypothetical protein
VLGGLVALKAEWTVPYLSDIVNNGKRVENGTTPATAEWGIWENWDLRNWIQRSIDDRNWDHTTNILLLCAQNNIPGHPYTILCLKLKELSHLQYQSLLDNSTGLMRVGPRISTLQTCSLNKYI